MFILPRGDFSRRYRERQALPMALHSLMTDILQACRTTYAWIVEARSGGIGRRECLVTWCIDHMSILLEPLYVLELASGAAKSGNYPKTISWRIERTATYG
jgi:hypothetical protein